MDERFRDICDATMEHIHYVLNQAGISKSIRFGRKTLRDSIPFDVGIIEHNKAIDYLLENNYLKQLGRHIVGLGTGEGLKDYDLSGFESSSVTHPEIPSEPPAEKPETTVKLSLDKEKVASTLSESVKGAVEKATKTAVEKTAISIKSDADRKTGCPTVDDDQLEQELLDIHRALNAVPIIENAGFKIKTLERLRLIFKQTSPATAAVLEHIINDYAELQQGEAA